MPPNWKSCTYCGQQFGASSLAIHMDRCRHRPDIAAEAALRAEENFARPAPLADWEHCPNCGEQYGKIAFPAHVKKCIRVRPQGANGYCAAGNSAGSQSKLMQKRAAKAMSEEDKVHALFDRFDTDKDGELNMQVEALRMRACTGAAHACTHACTHTRMHAHTQAHLQRATCMYTYTCMCSLCREHMHKAPPPSS